MTTNAHNLVDPSKDETGFSKLPTPQELARMNGAKGTQGNGSGDGKKKDLILGKFETYDAVLASYKELEQRLGLQGQEVGQLRQLTDKLLDLKKTEDRAKGGGSQGPSPVTSDELLRDPRAAIERVVGERTADLEARLAVENRERIRTEFRGHYPNFETDMQDPEFQNFVRTSPYRTTLATQASQGNVQAAYELWGAYAEAKAKPANAEGDKGKKSAEEIARAKALADATGMVTGSGGTGTGDGDSSNSDKPIYSRTAIIQMRINNPAGYYDPAFQAMLELAYKEKRVR